MCFICFVEGVWQQVLQCWRYDIIPGGLLARSGPSAGPCQPRVLAGPPGRSTCFCHWTWQGDECWEQGICLFASDLGINHKQLKLHRDK